MAEFVVKFEREPLTNLFLNKLELNFSITNSKNMLLKKDLHYFPTRENIYAIFEMTPIIPNVAKYGFFLTTLLYFIFLFFDKNLTFLFWFIGVFGLMATFWTKYFYYLILRNSTRKFGLLKAELL